MKPYGHYRYDKLECKYGCCVGKGGTRLRSRVVVDRAARKRARRQAKQEVSIDAQSTISVG